MIQKAPPHLTPAVCPRGKTFLFYYETLWALPSLLECFSNATQDVVGISSFMIILCPSVIEESQLPPRQLISSQMVSSIWEISGLKSQWSLLGGAPGWL